MVRRLLCGNALTESLEHEPVVPADVVAGEPSSAATGLGVVGTTEVGLWEITEGTVRDVETDEIFVVLSGEGSVTFEDGSVLDLAPGTVARLHEGERTEWEIRSPLRKVYVAPA